MNALKSQRNTKDMSPKAESLHTIEKSHPSFHRYYLVERNFYWFLGKSIASLENEIMLQNHEENNFVEA